MLRVWAFSVAVSLASFTCPEAKADSDALRLIGAWRYAGEKDTLHDGTPAPASALSDSQGLLIYTADGFVSANIMPKARKWVAETAENAELRETLSNGTAYSGHYVVDTKARTVTHVISVSVDPAYEGKRLVRGYFFAGDVLHLSGSFPYEGSAVQFDISWERAR